MCLSDVMPMHRFFKFLTPMAAGLALSGAALAQTPSASQLSASAESAAAWQGCVGKPDAERLTCFDQWARGQHELLSAIEDKARSAETSPSRNVAPSAQAAAVRDQVAAALATTQPAADSAAVASGSAGVIGVGLEQGCRDRQFSETSRFWELESGSSCPTFGLRAFHANTVSISGSDKVNRQPTSPNPANSATESVDYSKHAMRLQISVRTKLASGILTSSGGTLRDSLWAGYTSQSEWQVFNSDLSRPFRNTDHMPELIYVYPTTAKLPGGWLWRYSGVGLVHQSNGQSDPLSRSWNRAYLMTGFEKDDRFTVQLRLWHRLSEKADKDNNPNITRYLGRGDLTVGWNIDSKNSLRAVYSGFNGRGSGKLEWTRSLGDGRGNTFSGLRLYTSIFHGYGDSLLDYNYKRTTFRFGLSLVDF